jgi:predicted signal transduction protein with EAL and GGDEF domain
LGRSIGVPVLAEGIETREQWDFLAREGCASGQGYLLARPVPLDALPDATACACKWFKQGSDPRASLLPQTSPTESSRTAAAA